MNKGHVKGFGFFKKQQFTLNSGKVVQSNFPKTTYIVLGMLLLMIISARLTGFSWAELMRNGGEFWTIPRRMIPIDINYIDEVIPPLAETIQMSVLGSFIGSILAFPVAFLAEHYPYWCTHLYLLSYLALVHLPAPSRLCYLPLRLSLRYYTIILKRLTWALLRSYYRPAVREPALYWLLFFQLCYRHSFQPHCTVLKSMSDIPLSWAMSVPAVLDC